MSYTFSERRSRRTREAEPRALGKRAPPRGAEPQRLELLAQVAPDAELLEGVRVAPRSQAELLRSPPAAGRAAGPRLPD